ncbi:TIGR02281 family clan AA aspartic protease [Comamonadaceae bacterium OH2310_COT-174]|nr:TIGR02281 family clan AA aspartic protease [Comamonadaceae bacterium OH2310_COT-174]
MPAAMSKRPRQSRRPQPAALLGGLCALLLAGAAAAQDVRLVGTIGSRAIVSVDGGQPRTLAKGQSLGGVQLLEVQGNSATFQIGSSRQTLLVGQAPTHVTPGKTALTLSPSANGHYMSEGKINGHAVQFIVDTGASTIALDAKTARRLGIDYERSGQPIQVATANGKAQGWSVRLPTVSIGALTQRNVPATVVQQPMPFVLLGNSFLNHYQMTRDARSLVLKSK